MRVPPVNTSVTWVGGGEGGESLCNPDVDVYILLEACPALQACGLRALGKKPHCCCVRGSLGEG